jgi:hypothetical protein
MQKTVSTYLDHFHFDFDNAGAIVTLSPTAPDGLKHLFTRLCSTQPSESAICLYEGLAAIACADECTPLTFDPDICPANFMQELTVELERMVWD